MTSISTNSTTSTRPSLHLIAPLPPICQRVAKQVEAAQARLQAQMDKAPPIKMLDDGGMEVLSRGSVPDSDRFQIVSMREAYQVGDDDYYWGIDKGELISARGTRLQPGDSLHLRPDVKYEPGRIIHVSGIDRQGKEFETVRMVYHDQASGTILLWCADTKTPTITAQSDKIFVHGVAIGSMRHLRQICP